MRLENILVVRFLQWYLTEVPRKWWRAVGNLSPYVMEMFGVKIHARYLTVPMFHDTTGVGRFLSLAFRLIFIWAGVLVWILLMMAVLIFIVLWFGLHVMWFFYWPVGIAWWLALVGLFFWRFNSGEPWEEIDNTEFKMGNVLDASPDWLAELLQGYPGNLAKWWQDGRVGWWLARLGLHEVPMPGMGVGNPEILAHEVWSGMQKSGGVFVSAGELLWGLMQADEHVRATMAQAGVSSEDVLEIIDWYRREEKWHGQYPLWDVRFEVGEVAGYNRALTGLKTPTLDAVSIDLTANVGSLPEVIGRKEEYAQLLGILSRAQGENVMVIGENGVGKTTFISGLAHMIMRGNAPAQIANKRLVQLEPGRLLAGAKSQGELAGRMVAVIDELKASEGIILFVDEVHTLLTADSAQSGVNLFSIIEGALLRSNIQVLATTTPTNYKRYIEPTGGFANLFVTVQLKEPIDKDVLVVLESMALTLERRHGVIVSLQAMRAAIRLSKRYIVDQALPMKAKDILEEAVVRCRESGHLVTTDEDVAGVITRRTGVPVNQMSTGEREKLLHLEEEIHKSFVDQDVAVETVADALRRARLDVREWQRPIGTFLFVGPTGVGKTELARRLAAVYFGKSTAMYRFDMTEFSQEYMISRLIGSPVGTEGYGMGGELTEKVRRQPFSLVLLDEIEKAHPKVWDLLMQVMDAGRLTDAAGLTVDFRNTIIIATSNAVTAFIQQKIDAGYGLEDFKDSLFAELTKTFRVEFLNRFDSIVPFKPLTGTQMESVVRLELNKFVKRLATKEVTVTYDESLVQAMARECERVNLGARPVRRMIQDKLEAKVAKQMLATETVKGMVVRLEEDMIR